MMKALLFGLVAVGATAAGVRAAPTTFTLDASTKRQTSIMKSLDGIVMTLNNFTAGPNLLRILTGWLFSFLRTPFANFRSVQPSCLGQFYAILKLYNGIRRACQIVVLQCIV